MTRAFHLAATPAAMVTLLVLSGQAAAQAAQTEQTEPTPQAAQTPPQASTQATNASQSPTPGKSLGPAVTLPRGAGQVWREYEIASYTRKIGGVKPQQNVVDWVLRETGTEVWFGEPLGLLSATNEKLRVYHVPSVHQQVAGIVERLNQSVSTKQAVQLRLCTIANPNWRTKALRILTPVAAQSPGVDAWLLSKEDASMLVGELSRRVDYREHSTPNLQIPNGQQETVTRTQPRTYVRAVRPNGVVGLEQIQGSINEGYTLRVCPLLSADRQIMDAVVQCQIDQVEKLVTVPIDYASPTGTQRMQIETPQLVSWRLHERFRWPVDKVLLLSCGVVAQPGPQQDRGGFNLSRLPLPLSTGQTQRADALLFMEVNAPMIQATNPVRAAGNLKPGRRY